MQASAMEVCEDQRPLTADSSREAGRPAASRGRWRLALAASLAAAGLLATATTQSAPGQPGSGALANTTGLVAINLDCTCTMEAPDGLFHPGSPGKVGTCRNNICGAQPCCCDAVHSTKCGPAPPPVPAPAPAPGTDCACSMEAPDGLFHPGSPGKVGTCRNNICGAQPCCCDIVHSTKCGPASKDVRAPATGCSDAGKGCKDTQCCNDRKLTCFEKNAGWADCKATCEEGEPDKNSPAGTEGPWSCKKLDVRPCSVAGAGCADTKCCLDPNLKCFQKNNEWADCKATCQEGEADPNSPSDYQSAWTCKELTRTMCNAHASPPQKCPDGSPCPLCGAKYGHCYCPVGGFPLPK